MKDIDKVEIWLPKRPFARDAKDIGWHAHLDMPGVQPGRGALTPQEASKKLRELANHFDAETRPVPADVNMALAWELAVRLVADPGLPPSIRAMTAEQKADLLGAVDQGPLEALPTSREDFEPFLRVATLFGRIGSMTATSIPDLPDSLDRINVVLRMWAGSTDAGKTIAEDTRSGPNTAKIREDNSRGIETLASQDPVYAAGIEACVFLKGRRGEKMVFDGVPAGTRIHELQKLLPTA